MIDNQEKTIINFTPNGMVPMKDRIPTVPISSQEIIEQVHEAYELGITMVHVHARKKSGKPSSEAKDYAPIIEGIRKSCPDLVICASLSGRDVSDPVQRSEVLSLYPDMASLTLSSLNFPTQASLNSPSTIQTLATRIKEFGAHPELEVFDLGMANYLLYLIRKKLICAPFYVNIILGNIAGAQSRFEDIAAISTKMPPHAHIALGGIGQYQIDAHLMALGAGLGVRIGLEDNVYFDRSKKSITTNMELLRRMHQLIDLSGRKMMSARDFGQLGFYNLN